MDDGGPGLDVGFENISNTAGLDGRRDHAIIEKQERRGVDSVQGGEVEKRLCPRWCGCVHNASRAGVIRKRLRHCHID